MKIFPQNSRSFPGEKGNYVFFREFTGPWKKILKFQEFSRSTGKLCVFPGVYRALEENFEIPGVFQEYRSSEENGKCNQTFAHRDAINIKELCVQSEIIQQYL